MIRSLTDLSSAKARTAPTYTSPNGAGQETKDPQGSASSLPTIISKRQQTATTPGSSFLASRFPNALDSFTAVSEGQVYSATELQELVTATTGTQAALQGLVKASPGDWADRLTSRSVGAITGGGIGSSDGLRLLGGSSSSAVRSPVVVSLGAQLTVPVGLRLATADAALNSNQLAALGASTSITNAEGIAFVTGAKLQVPTSDITALPEASVACTVSARVDDNGAVHFILSPSTTNTSITIAPGQWYLYILFVLSAYTWS